MLHIDNPTPGQVLMLRAERAAQQWHTAMAIVVLAIGAEFGCWLAGAPRWLLTGLAVVLVPALLAAAFLRWRYHFAVVRVEKYVNELPAGDGGQ